MVLENSGRYRVAARIWDTDLRNQCRIRSDCQPTILHCYPDDLVAAQDQLVEAAVKLQAFAAEFDRTSALGGVSVLPELLRGGTLRMRLNLLNVGGDVVQDVLCRWSTITKGNHDDELLSPIYC